MKKMFARTIAVGLMLVVTLAGCGGSKEKSLTASDFEKVTMGMTVKDLEKELGKPTEKVTDQAKAGEAFAKDQASMTEAASKKSDAFNKFVGDKGQEELTKMFTGLSSDSKMSIYQYKYDKDKTKNIYVVDDKVILMNF